MSIVNDNVDSMSHDNSASDSLQSLALRGFLSTTCFIGSKNQDKSSEYCDFGVLRLRHLMQNRHEIVNCISLFN